VGENSLDNPSYLIELRAFRQQEKRFEKGKRKPWNMSDKLAQLVKQLHKHYFSYFIDKQKGGECGAVIMYSDCHEHGTTQKIKQKSYH